MNTFWTMMLNTAVKKLMSGDWVFVINEVMALMTADIPGKEKKEIAFESLRKIGINCATWLLYIAIEVAYSQAKK